MLRKLTDVRVVGGRIDAILHTGILFRKKILVHKYVYTVDWWVDGIEHTYKEFTAGQNLKLEKLYNRSAYD